MELSSSLVKSLASVTNDTITGSAVSAATAYGTVVVDDGTVYVKLDGSSTLTAISAATDVRNGDRVLVSIENHAATIINNITTPASGYTASETAEAVKKVTEDVTVLNNGKNSIYYSETAPSSADFTLLSNDLWFQPNTVDGAVASYTLYRWTGETWALVEYSSDNLAVGSVIAEKINVGTLSAIAANLGEITGGSLSIGNGTFAVDSNGVLTASSGTVGGFTMTKTKLFSTNTIAAYESDDGSDEDEYSPDNYDEGSVVVTAQSPDEAGTVNFISADCSEDDSTFLAVAAPTTDDGSYDVTNASAYILHDGRAKFAALSCFGALRNYNHVYTSGGFNAGNNYGLWIANASGTYVKTVWLNSYNNVGVGPTNRNYGLYLWGSNIYANNFRVPEIQRGAVSITPAEANKPTDVEVTFSKEFSGTPRCFVTAATTVPGTVVTGVSVADVTTTGMTVYLTRTTTVATTVHWIAVY